MKNKKTIIRSLKDMNNYISNQQTKTIEKKEQELNTLMLELQILKEKEIYYQTLVKESELKKKELQNLREKRI
jgi:hypothetical protein